MISYALVFIAGFATGNSVIRGWLKVWAGEAYDYLRAKMGSK